MQKLGKKFPDHLQKSACILMTEFLGTKIFWWHSVKLARVAPCFLKCGFVRAFWRPRMQRTRLLLVPLSRQVWSQFLLVRAVGVSEFWVLERPKGWLREDSWIHKREGQTEECVWKADGRLYDTKLLGKYKIANSQNISLDIIHCKLNR